MPTSAALRQCPGRGGSQARRYAWGGAGAAADRLCLGFRPPLLVVPTHFEQRRSHSEEARRAPGRSRPARVQSSAQSSPENLTWQWADGANRARTPLRSPMSPDPYSIRPKRNNRRQMRAAAGLKARSFDLCIRQSGHGARSAFRGSDQGRWAQGRSRQAPTSPGRIQDNCSCRVTTTGHVPNAALGPVCRGAFFDTVLAAFLWRAGTAYGLGRVLLGLLCELLRRFLLPPLPGAGRPSRTRSRAATCAVSR